MCLECINPNLKLRQWCVLQHTADSQSSRSILEVETGDVEETHRANFCAFARLDHGVFKILQEPEKKTDEGKAESSSNTKPPMSPASIIGEFENLALESGMCLDSELQPSSPGSILGMDEVL